MYLCVLSPYPALLPHPSLRCCVPLHSGPCHHPSSLPSRGLARWDPCSPVLKVTMTKMSVLHRTVCKNWARAPGRPRTPGSQPKASVRSLASERLYSLICESGTTEVPAPKSHCEVKLLTWHGSRHATCWVGTKVPGCTRLFNCAQNTEWTGARPSFKGEVPQMAPDGWTDKGTWPIYTVEYSDGRDKEWSSAACDIT